MSADGRSRRYDPCQTLAGGAQAPRGARGQGAQGQTGLGVEPAASAPELIEGPEPCRHTWGEPVTASFSSGDSEVIRVCETCQGFTNRCKRCRGFHLVCVGQGGEHSMPWWVDEEWLREHGCARRNLEDVPIPFVWMPDFDEPPMFDLASYGEIDGEPGRYELEWFS